MSRIKSGKTVWSLLILCLLGSLTTWMLHSETTFQHEILDHVMRAEFLEGAPDGVPNNQTNTNIRRDARKRKTPSRTIAAFRGPRTRLSPKQPTKMQLTDELDVELLRDQFKAKTAPIISEPADKTTPVRIRVLLFENSRRSIGFRKGPTSAIGDEVLNICMDGFEQSSYFKLLDFAIIPDDPNYYLEEKNDVVWVVDMRRMVSSGNRTTITQVASLVQQTLQYQKGLNRSTPSLKLVFMDYRDKSSISLCYHSGTKEIQEMLGTKNVRQVTQQIVIAREWSEKQQFPLPGVIANGYLHKCFRDYPTLHVPYTVRSDYAIAVQEKYSSFLPMHKTTMNHPSDTLRPIDVAHFWRAQKKDSSANLRNSVTQLLLASFQNTTIDGKPINVIGDFVSSSGGIGRTSVQDGYIEALLTTKIVVVAQRDAWEDHYRLFEGIIGGALVMTDPMLSLPDGYVDRENIVIYKSTDELRQLILYYLEHTGERVEIARKGWNLAMSRHRTYHWMEELFFGQPLTQDL